MLLPRRKARLSAIIVRSGRVGNTVEMNAGL